MKSFWRATISLVTVISMLPGMMPWMVQPAETAGETPATAQDVALTSHSLYGPSRLHPEAQSEDVSPEIPALQASDGSTVMVYLPLVARHYTPPLPSELLIEPGIGGTVGTPDRRVQVTFTSVAVTETARVTFAEIDRPAQSPDNLAMAGQPFVVTAERLSSGQPLKYFPFPVTVFTDTNPWWSIYTPTVIITKTFTDPEIWGLDLSVLSLYRRTGPGRNDWIKVPSAVYLDERRLYAEVETIGEFALMSRLAIYAQGSGAARLLAVGSPTVLNNDGYYKLVMDADDDVGHVCWPDEGCHRELDYNVRLAQEVRSRLTADACRVEVLLTREVADPAYLSRTTRANMARDFGADIFATFAFNTLTGRPCGYQR